MGNVMAEWTMDNYWSSFLGRNPKIFFFQNAHDLLQDKYCFMTRNHPWGRCASSIMTVVSPWDLCLHLSCRISRVSNLNYWIQKWHPTANTKALHHILWVYKCTNLFHFPLYKHETLSAISKLFTKALQTWETTGNVGSNFPQHFIPIFFFLQKSK